MARKAEKEKTKDGLKLKIVNPNAAGIDIAYGEMKVCVPEDRDGENNLFVFLACLMRFCLIIFATLC